MHKLAGAILFFPYQAVGWVAGLHAVYSCIGPFGNSYFFFFAYYSVFVYEGVGAKWHFAFFYLLYYFFQFFVLPPWAVGCKFIKILFAFAFGNMMVEPPAYRLNFGIPWVIGVIAMAVVAAFL